MYSCVYSCVYSILTGAGLKECGWFGTGGSFRKAVCELLKWFDPFQVSEPGVRMYVYVGNSQGRGILLVIVNKWSRVKAAARYIIMTWG